LLDALDRYGRSGRFYYLDILGDEPQQWENPSDLWDLAERVAEESDTRLSRLKTDALADIQNQALWDTFISSLNARMAESVRQWWEMICILGRHGVLGMNNKSFGFEAPPDMVGGQA
jgi:hypothetical protein